MLTDTRGCIPVYKCKRCAFETSGIYGQSGWNPQCPRCHAPLFRCMKCFKYTSAEKTGQSFRCDHCSKETPIHEAKRK